MVRDLLIMGIDPGTTLAYALINLNGTIIKIDSSKQFSFNSLISTATSYGNILFVGCDKKKIPDFVEKFSIKVGAKVKHPEEDLLVREKQRVTNEIKLRNKHEMDALASAILVYNEIQPSLKRIRRFVKKNNAEKYETEITERVLKQGESLRLALDKLTTSSVSKQKKVAQIEKPNPPSKLKALLKNQEREIKLLHRQNTKLKSRLRKVQKRDQYILREVAGIKTDEELQELVRFKDKNIHGLLREIEEKGALISQRESTITTLYRFFSMLSTHTLIKKMKNLGFAELERINPLITIHEKDILLVDDPNQISRKTIAFLHDKVSVIIHRKPVSKKINRDLPFIFIGSDKLKIVEEDHFALVNKKELRKYLDGKALLTKIVADYQQQREMSALIADQSEH